MNAQPIEVLIEKLKPLPPNSARRPEDFVDFRTGKAKKGAALDWLLAIAPPARSRRHHTIMSMEEINAGVKARPRRAARPLAINLG